MRFIMPIVSISEAAELTGKTRRTIQRHVASGKLSRSVASSGRIGVDTSELIRTYGQLTSHDVNTTMSQSVIPNVTYKNDKKDTEHLLKLEHELSIVKIELEAERRRVQDKQETIDSLKTALKLLEYRQEKTETIPLKETQIASEPPQNTPTDPIEPPTPSTSFWNGFKKLFR